MSDPTVPAWIEDLLAGDRAALARAITAVENDTPEAGAVRRAISERLGGARVIGVTGPPGAGKSTLVASVITCLREQGKSVGVIAADPSSAVSGGALLGDRLRMGRHAGDDKVFIRSLAARGHLGGLSRAAVEIIDIMDASGRDFILVETVGTGQSEIEIAELADVRLVVVAPGLGDEVQAIKAGVLEIADIVVVNKADQPSADRTARQLELRLPKGPEGEAIPVLRTVASSGAGVPELVGAVERIAKSGRVRPGARDRMRRLLIHWVVASVRGRLERSEDARLDELCDRLREGKAGFEAAVDLVFEILRDDGTGTS